MYAVLYVSSIVCIVLYVKIVNKGDIVSLFNKNTMKQSFPKEKAPGLELCNLQYSIEIL